VTDTSLIGRDGRTDGRVCPSVAVTTLQGAVGARRGPDGVPDGGSTGARRGQVEGPDGYRTGARQGARRDARQGPHGVPHEGRMGCPTGARRGARRGGGQKDYLLLKEKMTCTVYVSYKSSSASDVSDARWI
jgi:hypothetical protein